MIHILKHKETDNSFTSKVITPDCDGSKEEKS